MAITLVIESALQVAVAQVTSQAVGVVVALLVTQADHPRRGVERSRGVGQGVMIVEVRTAMVTETAAEQ